MSEQNKQLAQIYNILMSISTKGEDTIRMANCLGALYNVINAPQVEDDAEE